MNCATNVVNTERDLRMKTVPVRIDEELVESARKAAASEFRTIQGQLEFWIKVGRASLDNPGLPVDFIKESLMSMATPREDATPFVPRSKTKQ